MKKYPWLPLSAVNAAVPAMEASGAAAVARGAKASTVTREGFVEAYRAVGGRPARMKTRIARGTESWARRRTNFIKRHMAQVKANKESLFSNGVPTARLLGLIAWAYVPPSVEKRVARWYDAGAPGAKMRRKNPQNLTSRSERVIQHLVRKCGMSEHAAREAVGKQKGEGSDRPALTPDGLAIYEKAVKRVIRMAPYRAIFLLLPRTGLRIGEMVTMTWDRLDRDRGIWIVVGKNSDVREVPVTRDTWKILDQYCAEYNPKSRSPHWVFPRWKGPDHVSTSRAGSAMRALRHDDKRLEALTPHVLRHTFATQKLHECASPEELRRVMGHRGKAVAMLYYHL